MAIWSTNRGLQPARSVGRAVDLAGGGEAGGEAGGGPLRVDELAPRVLPGPETAIFGC